MRPQKHHDPPGPTRRSRSSGDTLPRLLAAIRTVLRLYRRDAEHLRSPALAVFAVGASMAKFNNGFMGRSGLQFRCQAVVLKAVMHSISHGNPPQQPLNPVQACAETGGSGSIGTLQFIFSRDKTGVVVLFLPVHYVLRHLVLSGPLGASIIAAGGDKQEFLI